MAETKVDIEEVSVSIARVKLGDLMEEVANTGRPIRIIKGDRSNPRQVVVMLMPDKPRMRKVS